MARNIFIIFLVVLICCLYALNHVATFITFPRLFDRQPLLLVDYSMLYYFSFTSKQFFKQNFQLWGYDPFYSCGFPLSFIWNSNVAIQTFSIIFSWLTTSAAIKVFHVLILFLFPCFIFLSFKNFGFDSFSALLGTVLSVTYFRLDLPLLFSIYGMDTTYLATYFSFFTISNFYRYVKKPTFKTLFILAILTSLVFLIHKTSLIMIFIPFLILLSFLFFKFGWKKFTLTFFMLMFSTIIVNWYWIYPVLRLMHYKVFLQDAPMWQNYDFFKPLHDYFSFSLEFLPNRELPFMIGTVILRNVLLWLGIVGMTLWFVRKKWLLFCLFGLTAIFLFTLAYWGSFWHLTAILNPYRYIANFNLLLVVPSVVAFVEMNKFFTRKYDESVKVFFSFFCVLLIFILNFLVPFYWGIFDSSFLTKKSLDKNLIEIINWIKLNTSDEGRILIEGSGIWDREWKIQRYNDIYLTALIPILTKRKLASSPYPYMFLKHGYVDFKDGSLLGKPINEYSLEGIKNIFDLYNIKWVIGWSDDAEHFFSQHPDFFRKVNGGKFSYYTINKNSTYFYRGEGNIFVTHNKILIYNLKPQKSDFVLKYHWLENIKSNPQVGVEKVEIANDPIGFIKIKNPKSSSIVLTF